MRPVEGKAGLPVAALGCGFVASQFGAFGAAFVVGKGAGTGAATTGAGCTTGGAVGGPIGASS
jgi:hypothetical protein